MFYTIVLNRKLIYYLISGCVLKLSLSGRKIMQGGPPIAYKLDIAKITIA